MKEQLESFPEPEKNPLKAEHLKEGVPPIIAAVGTFGQFLKNSEGLQKFFKEGDMHSLEIDSSRNSNVDYFGNPRLMRKKGFENSGRETYVISPVDNLDKFSVGFMNCTGLIAAGRDKETGENISFLSHQDPNYFLRWGLKKHNFIRNLKTRLKELKERSEEGTIDAVIVGGNYLKDDNKFQKFKKWYLGSIKLLGEETSEILGFEPIVLSGPKFVDGGDEVFYNNKERHVYLIRPEVGDKSTEPYIAKNIGEQEKEWEE